MLGGTLSGSRSGSGRGGKRSRGLAAGGGIETISENIDELYNMGFFRRALEAMLQAQDILSVASSDDDDDILYLTKGEYNNVIAHVRKKTKWKKHDVFNQEYPVNETDIDFDCSLLVPLPPPIEEKDGDEVPDHDGEVEVQEDTNVDNKENNSNLRKFAELVDNNFSREEGADTPVRKKRKSSSVIEVAMSSVLSSEVMESKAFTERLRKMVEGG